MLQYNSIELRWIDSAVFAVWSVASRRAMQFSDCCL